MLTTSLSVEIERAADHSQCQDASEVRFRSGLVTVATNSRKSRLTLACFNDLASNPVRGRIQELLEMKTRNALLLLSVVGVLASLSVTARSQSSSYSGDSDGTPATKIPVLPELTYVRPTHKTKADNYLFDAFGPYPIVGAAFAAGINQISNSPPEWRQGAGGFGKRLGSDFATSAIETTTRFGLAEAFKEDTLYYGCACSGVWPRMSHAVTSTLAARRGDDGHYVFSLPALLAPYASNMTAVYGWYPDRFGAKDAFRMGNYSLLIDMGENVALEFLNRGPHSLLSRVHIHQRHSPPHKELTQ